MRKYDTINVIPFVDILLVLLAIVLTTATFVARGELEVTLPAAREAGVPDLVDAVGITIDRDERLYLDGVETTLAALSLALGEVPGDTRVVLAIDETVPFTRFVALVDVLKTHGLDDVAVRTRTGD